jgi:hypothetical protein
MATQIPRDLLACIAHGGWSRTASSGDRPRTLDHEQVQDVQEPWKCRQSVRGYRPLRRGRREMVSDESRRKSTG